jgi:ABC-type bacteriocin/lantibiotic exporter with double-glycine peptidase domain
MPETVSPLTPVQRFWRLLKPDQKEITNVYVYAIFSGLVNLSLPLGIQAIVNLIQGGQISTSWVVLVTIVVLGVVITGVLQIFQLRITENLQQRIFTRAALEFAYRIPRLKLERLYKEYAPELVNRFFDTISIQKGLAKILIEFSTAILHIVFGLVLLSVYHPFFIAFSGILIVLILAIFRFTTAKGLKTSLDESKYKYSVQYWLEELARTATTFKLAGNTSLPMQRTDKLLGGYLASRESHFKVLVQQYSLMVVFKALIATALLAIGGVLVFQQRMNIGQFVAAEIIILMVISAVEKLIMSFETIFDVLTSLEKVGQVTDLELERNNGERLVENDMKPGYDIVLNTVNFSYPGFPIASLNNISLTLEAGKKYVVTGANGSGKSSLLRVVAALYDPQSGHITFNGHHKESLDLEHLRTSMGDYMNQEELFEGSLLDNISLGREGVTLENMTQAIGHVGLSEYLSQLPDGYQTKIAPQGKNLPASVAQRLLLARSFVHNPKVLLLEDAFEHLDDQCRMDLIDYLIEKERPWTMVASSTDPYLLGKADKIAVLEKGKLIAFGTYPEVKHLLTFKNNNHA